MPSAGGELPDCPIGRGPTAPATAIYPDSETINVLGPPPAPAGFTTTLVSGSEEVEHGVDRHNNRPVGVP